MKKVLLFLLAIVGLEVYSQNINFKTMDVSKMSDGQIRRISTEMAARGYSFDDIRVLAKAKGASEKQLDDLEKRLQDLKLGQKKGLDKSIALDKFEGIATESEESEKAFFLPTSADSLIFGFKLFNNEKLTFEPNVNMPVPEGYILGVGDELIVDVWGRSSMSYQLKVASNGCVNIPIAGPVNVLGLTVKEASNRIEAKLKTIYSDLGSGTSISVKMGSLKTITVNVMGEVFAPGTYTVSSVASLFNVLYLCGGPNQNGSFRNVQLLRGGKLVATLDVYDYLLNYKTDVNVPLYSNDIVMVPTYQKRVAVGGEFKRIGYFEAKEGETVEDIIRYAGGFKPYAVTDHIGLLRVGKYGKEYKDVVDPSSVSVMNGDSLSVNAINVERVDNTVEIKGGVFIPGNYEFRKGMKLSELLHKSGGLVENAFLNRGVITRLKPDFTYQSLNFNVADLAAGKYDVELNDNDVITISTIDDQREKPILTIKGAVKNPDEYDYAENITIGDLILLAGGLLDDASVSKVEIVRRLSYDVADTSEYSIASNHFVCMTKDLSIDSKDNDFRLEPFDVVTIRRYPSAQFNGTVTITGEVLFEGTYEMVNREDNVLSMIERAGGLTKAAYIDGAKLFRRVRLLEKEKNMRIMQAMMQSEDTTKINMLMSDEDSYELVSIDLRKIFSDKKALNNLRLLDGDEIVIPSKMQTVKVGGEVLNPIALTWTKKMSARKYINMAGGFSTKAKRGKTYVIYPDGHADATGHFLWFKHYPKVEPGCEVMVPTKPEREGMTPAQVVSLSSSILTMIVVILNLTK
ncbi:MAG: SLBB domain-containing protein [Paludibacteraceae bacterium]|nr:SLBB domain-containing protein [Paludibacteraceae bacterium]